MRMRGLLSAGLVAFLTAGFAVAGRVGEIRSQSGEVSVAGVAASNGTAVGADEVVETGPSSSATLMVAGGTQLRLAPNTRVRITVIPGESRPPCGRGKTLYRVQLLVGSFSGQADGNPRVGIEIVTPMGVATPLDGQGFHSSVLPDGGVAVGADTGPVSVVSPTLGWSSLLGAGHRLILRRSADGSVSVEAPATNPGASALLLADGCVVTLSPGAKVQFVTADGISRLTVLTATVKLGDATLEPGQSLAFANPGTGSTSVLTETGLVEFVDSMYGMLFDVASGEGVELTEQPGGGLGFAIHDSPTPMTMTYGGKTVTFSGGSKGSFGCGPDGLTFQLESGRAVIRDEAGNETVVEAGGSAGLGEFIPFSDLLVGAACGQCGVADGVGGCRYIDALCDTDPCVTGRRCVAGVCAGGRRLTSREDPTCY